MDDDKKMAAKNKDPSVDIDDNPNSLSASDKEDDDDDVDDQDGEEEEENVDIKSLFCGLLDAQPNVPASFLSFTFNAPYDSTFVFKAVDDADHRD